MRKDQKDVMLEKVEFTPAGGFELVASHPGFANLAAELVQFFRDNKGENYVELSVYHAETGPMALTLQRQEGKTPGQIVAELKNRVTELTEMIIELRDNPDNDAFERFERQGKEAKS